MLIKDMLPHSKTRSKLRKAELRTVRKVPFSSLPSHGIFREQLNIDLDLDVPQDGDFYLTGFFFSWHGAV